MTGPTPRYGLAMSVTRPQRPAPVPPSSALLWTAWAAVVIGALGPWVAVSPPAAQLDGSGLGGHPGAALACVACLPLAIILRRDDRHGAAAALVLAGTLIATFAASELPGDALQSTGGGEAHVAWGLLVTTLALTAGLVAVLDTWAGAAGARRIALGTLSLVAAAGLVLATSRSIALTVCTAGLVGAAACLRELRAAPRSQ